jgi:hypothetical protein
MRRACNGQLRVINKPFGSHELHEGRGPAESIQVLHHVVARRFHVRCSPRGGGGGGRGGGFVLCESGTCHNEVMQ